MAKRSLRTRLRLMGIVTWSATWGWQAAWAHGWDRVVCLGFLIALPLLIDMTEP